MHCSLLLEMFTLYRVDHKVTGVQILLLWKSLLWSLTWKSWRASWIIFCANIFYDDHIQNIVTSFGSICTYPIKTFVKYRNMFSLLQSSNKNILPNERNYFLGLIEVSISTLYKHTKTYNKYLLRIGGKEKIHILFSLYSYIFANSSHFPTNMEAFS